MSAEPRPAERMPGWMHRAVECGPEFRKVEGLLDREGLNTVCVGARCPNRGECYSHGTATFMIMGDRCSRDCGFCAVPSGGLKPLDQGEPEAVARAAARLDLKHVVITSVTRDDIGDGGAGHFARTVRAVRAALPDAVVEVLVGDFQGRAEDIATVLAEEPEVFNHNLETVARLQEEVRPQADYGRSLEVIRQAAGAGLRAKSGFMVGLGETVSEVEDLLVDLRESGCRLLTIGQYLRPAERNLAVARYWEPREFERLEAKALALGFEGVAAGPLVRSSYFAHELLHATKGSDLFVAFSQSEVGAGP
jgi:lipoic acid synthetase